ncbi:MAG TPA: succinate dehydrogenase, cytochrome b556 subunit [Burkholderiales bacterium]|nr:succinate dehydrogenase, cytochrome b556 subunit [Burkholderiales bacterium]
MPDLAAKRKRPVWFNLSLLNLPAPGLVSIFHRVSGAWLFLGLVWFLFLLEMSLGSEAGFEHARAYVSHPVVKLALLAFLWSYLHHFCAGVRYLFLDMDVGLPLASARRSAFLVLAVSLALTVVIGARLW